MATKTMPITTKAVMNTTKQATPAKMNTANEITSSGRRIYPDITREQSFWDKAVLS